MIVFLILLRLNMPERAPNLVCRASCPSQGRSPSCIAGLHGRVVPRGRRKQGARTRSGANRPARSSRFDNPPPKKKKEKEKKENMLLLELSSCSIEGGNELMALELVLLRAKAVPCDSSSSPCCQTPDHPHPVANSTFTSTCRQASPIFRLATQTSG